MPDTLTYLWSSSGGGIFANATLKDTTWTAPDVSQETVVTLTLLVTDLGGLTDTDSVDVTVQDAPATIDYAVNAGNVSWVFAVPQPTITHTPATSGDEVSITVPLTDESVFDSYIRWSDNYSLGSLFDANGEEQILSLVDLNNANPAGQVRISITGTNNRFTPEFEATGQFTFTASDGESVTVVLANADMSEIYQWTPANSAEVVAFVLHVKTLIDQTGTLTLTGEGTTVPTDHAVDAGNASWAFALPQPTVTHTTATPVTTNHAVNAESVAWSLYPSTAVRHTHPSAWYLTSTDRL